MFALLALTVIAKTCFVTCCKCKLKPFDYVWLKNVALRDETLLGLFFWVFQAYIK